MSENFRRWESDPLFSAAEVVQDSADRMESVFRILSHDHHLFKNDPSDTKLLNSIEYHKRDLLTALGTTKWQLEDFERAVHFSSMSDTSNLRKNAISRHKLFINAIKEQILLVEKSLDKPDVGDLNENVQWVTPNEQDGDVLALFLSGGGPLDNNTHNSSHNIMKRFLDSTSSSGCGDKSDEIVELHEEDEQLASKGANYIRSSTRKNDLNEEGSCRYNTSISHKESTCENEYEIPTTKSGRWDLEIGDSSSRSLSSQNTGEVFNRSFHIMFPLSKLWLVFGRKLTKSFIKRRKDGEVTDDLVLNGKRRLFPLVPPLLEEEKEVKYWTRQTSDSWICQGLQCESMRSIIPICWFEASNKKITRSKSQYFIQYKQYPLRATSAILIILLVLGFLGFKNAGK